MCRAVQEAARVYLEQETEQCLPTAKSIPGESKDSVLPHAALQSEPLAAGMVRLHWEVHCSMGSSASDPHWLNIRKCCMVVTTRNATSLPVIHFLAFCQQSLYQVPVGKQLDKEQFIVLFCRI